LLHAHLALGQALPEELEGVDLVVEGVVASIPQGDGRRWRFELVGEGLLRAGEALPGIGRVRLGWYGDRPGQRQRPAAGERWRLPVRLKRPSGFFNPGGFDYEGWLFREGLAATGWVTQRGEPQRLGDGGWRYGLLRLRAAIGERIRSLVPDPAAAEVLVALTIGEGGGIAREQWEVFNRVGVTHLLVISGSHIAMVAGLIFLLVRRGWCLSSRLPLWVPAPVAGAVASLLAGAAYGALAGFDIPVQRALIMLAVFLGALVGRRALRAGHGLVIALLLVVAWDPLAVLSPGFWLSYGAVAALLYGLACSRQEGGARLLMGWGRAQWVVFLGLLPLLVALGMRVSVVAPLANLVAVPLFSLLVVPLALLGALLAWPWPDLGALLLGLDAWLLTAWGSGMAWLAGHPWVAWGAPRLPVWGWGLALLGGILLLAPRGLPGRPLGALLLLPLITRQPPGLEPGSLRVALLDVGQGLALVLRTANHTLLYDTGPRFSADFDAGSAVVVPFLRAQGIDRLDRVVISNGDSDHRGGLEGVQAEFGVTDILSGEADQVPGAAPCRAGHHWRWDGVEFAILHPAPGGRWRGNDASCVLRVATAGGTLLVAGDIEGPAEAALLRQDPAALGADVVIVPHHGSRTSSTPGFVAAVGARYALISAGYRNQFGFPKAEVTARWRQGGADWLTTAAQGAIQWEMGAGGIGPMGGYRMAAGRYWNRLPADEAAR
jgi:competence protein ComEC